MFHTNSKYKKPRVAIVMSEINFKTKSITRKKTFHNGKKIDLPGRLTNPKHICTYYCPDVHSPQSDYKTNAILMKSPIGFSLAEIDRLTLKFI